MLVCVEYTTLVNLQNAVNDQQLQWNTLKQQLDLLQRHILERVPLIPCPCNGCTQEDPTAASIIASLLAIANSNVTELSTEINETADAITILDGKLDDCDITELTP